MDKTQKRMEALKAVQIHESASNKDVQRHCGVSQSTASQRISELEEAEWISKFSKGRSNVLEITEDGKKALEEWKDCPHPGSATNQSIPNSNNTILQVRAHNCSVRARISDDIPVLGRWFETWTEETNREYTKTDDGYITTVQGLKCRFTKDYIIIFLPEVTGQDVVDTKNRVYQKASEKLDMLEEKTPFKIEDDAWTPRFSLRRQELALMDDPFAEAVVNSEDVGLEGQRYRDADGEVRFHIDHSDGVPELEFVNKDLGEEDANFYRDDVIGKLLENKGPWNDFTEKLEGDHLDRTEQLLRMLTEFVTLREVGGMGQLQKKQQEKQPEGLKELIDNLRATDRQSMYSTEGQGQGLREEPDNERWERLNKLEGRLEMRMEKFNKKENGGVNRDEKIQQRDKDLNFSAQGKSKSEKTTNETGQRQRIPK